MADEITINLDYDNVTVVDLKDSFLRANADGILSFDDHEEFNTACDEAQAQVFTGQHKVSYVVLKITHEEIE